MTTYHQRLQLVYTVEQMFDLVADVERYPEFVPWITATRIRKREGHIVHVDMTIGTRLIAKKFASVETLDRPRRLDVASRDPVVERFEQTWTFEPSAEGGAVVNYDVTFALRSGLLQMLIDTMFADRAASMVGAFKRRARVLYGRGARRG
jgi:coenzyme Q-binding protein COQ10